MPDITRDYFDALKRLVSGKPDKVPKGTKITNDSVSLEAGRKKGTIKKSRPVFSDLINAINAAATVDTNPADEMRKQLDQAKAETRRYRELWEQALAREVSLVKELWDVKDAWKEEREAIAAGKVELIRKSARPQSNATNR
jgi:hypothetical protein